MFEYCIIIKHHFTYLKYLPSFFISIHIIFFSSLIFSHLIYIFLYVIYFYCNSHMLSSPSQHSLFLSVVPLSSFLNKIFLSHILVQPFPHLVLSHHHYLFHLLIRLLSALSIIALFHFLLHCFISLLILSSLSHSSPLYVSLSSLPPSRILFPPQIHLLCILYLSSCRNNISTYQIYHFATPLNHSSSLLFLSSSLYPFYTLSSLFPFISLPAFFLYNNINCFYLLFRNIYKIIPSSC